MNSNKQKNQKMNFIRVKNTKLIIFLIILKYWQDLFEKFLTDQIRKVFRRIQSRNEENSFG